MFCMSVAVGPSPRHENELKGLEKRVLSQIFWSEQDEVIRNWRKLHNEEVYYL